MAKPGTATSMKDDDDYKPGETQQELAERQRKAAEAAGQPAAPSVAVLVLQAGRVRPLEGTLNQWEADCDHGVTKEDLERTAFWVHNAKLCRPRDFIHAFCVDGSFYARLLVTAIGPKDVRCHTLEFVKLDPVDPNLLALPAGYTVGWAGTIAKWRVIRNGQVLREGFDQESMARSWLSNHITSVAR